MHHAPVAPPSAAASRTPPGKARAVPRFTGTGAALALLLGLTALVPITAKAVPGEVTAADYARAASFLPGRTRPLVDHDVQRVKWLDDHRFWYVDHDAGGDHYRVMDAATGKAIPAFDQARLATALGRATGQPVAANHLRIADYRPMPDGRLEVSLAGAGDHSSGTSYLCDLDGDGRCVDRRSALAHKPGTEPGTVSPDGRLAVFVRDWNLWLRDLDTGKETRLTTDGVENFGYATDNSGWQHSDAAIVKWSPDSTRVATYQQDQRTVGDMYVLHTGVGHPRLEQWKEPLVGDRDEVTIAPVVIDVRNAKVTRLKMAAELHQSTLCDSLACDPDPTGWSDAKWAPDSRTLALVGTSRDRRHEWFRVADAETGAVRTVFEDSVKTFYESGRGMVNWQYLPETHEAIWFSERTDWGNLYLHDLKTGKDKHAITQGPGNVDQVRHLDRRTRTLWFVGNARTPGLNPYYRQFFKTDVDTGKTLLLTPEPADHQITMSPDGRYFVDSYSTVEQPPTTVLRASGDGHVIATVARAGIGRLRATGWTPPEVVTVRARDGKTTLYGLLFKPTHFDPHGKYPVIDYVYPGPQTGSVSSFGWAAAHGDRQAMAELGFVVLAVNGMGTPWRTKYFHDAWYRDVADNTLPDQVTAIRQLAGRYPWIDAGRVGMWGHSGGGNATVAAMFHYPDFFKVGWAESGNHDMRNYESYWGEKYQGLLVTHPDGTTNYDSQANPLFAGNLKGHLMLVHGSVDPNVPVGETLLVADALIKANKDFDMLILPNQQHGYGADTAYVTRRRWDYFVKHLLGATPPPGPARAKTP
jgi:dipeptidyl aminopeptidase/acylaminoacyl peptidase